MTEIFQKIQEKRCLFQRFLTSIASFLCQKKGSKSRLAKSHDLVASLPILGPVLRTQELETDFSPFLEKSNSKKKKSAVGFVSKLDINR